MGQKIASLEIELGIDSSQATADMVRFGGVTDKVVIQAMRHIDELDSKMANVGGLTKAEAAVIGLAGETAKTKIAMSREFAAIERAGESMAAQLDRQLAVFGRTASEVRSLKAETAALAAEQKGMSELAERIRAKEQELYDAEFAAMRRARQEAEALAAERAVAAAMAQQAAEKEAQAIRSAAQAHQIFEAKVRAGAAALREQEAAEKAVNRDAAAAQLRAEADAAARLAAEHARLAAQVRASYAAQEADAQAAERLRSSTDPLYAAMKRLNEEIAESTRLYHSGATAPAEYARQQQVLAKRLRETSDAHDVMGNSARRGAGSLTQLSFQANDVVTMFAMGAPVFQIFASQAGQMVQVVQMAEGGLKGLAAELGALAIAYAPLLLVAGAAIGAFALFDGAVSKGIDTKPMVDGLGLTHAEIKRLKDVSVDTGDVMTATFQVLAKNVGISLSGVKDWFGGVLDWITTAGRQYLATIYASWVGTFKAIGVIVQDVFAGKGISEIMSDVAGSYKGAFNDADQAMVKFGENVNKQIKQNKQAELEKQAAEIKADRTPKKDTHGDQLRRNAEATEAQIRNLYKLADAYGVSGAAALVAEAQVKAESQAIKARGDIEAFVNREIRLAVAERVSDAAKATATMRDQAEAQERVNAQVEAGLIPASRAADLISDQIADLPLLAAIQVSQQRGLADEAARATRALEDQRKERDRLAAAKVSGQFEMDKSAGANQLAMLREELRLVGATDAARVHALATLKATQEAEAKHFNPKETADYIRQQAEIADTQQQLSSEQAQFNDELRLTADLAQTAAGQIADAFGEVGGAIGDVISILGTYGAKQKAIDDQVAAGKMKQADADLLSRSTQLESYGALAGAAKGLFKEHSAGYQAMAAAEKAFAIVQLANTAVNLAAGAAKMFGQVGIGAFAPIAAMIAVMAALGFSGGSGSVPSGIYKAEDVQKVQGTGSILGDNAAQSESLAKSLDLLSRNSLKDLEYANSMERSLRSIDGNIGNLSGLLASQLGVSAGDTSNLGLGKTTTSGTGTALLGLGGLVGVGIGKALGLDRILDGVSSVIGAIPVVGGVVNTITKALFGTTVTTSLVDEGVKFYAGTLAEIMQGGIEGANYSLIEIQKKKKFLGITSSNKTGTEEYADALDSEVSHQATLLIQNIYKSVTDAATAVGLDGVDQLLQSFELDLGKISLKDLKGDEISQAISAVFSQAADDMAAAAIPGLQAFQKVGEGTYETLIRLAKDYQTIDAVMSSLGRAFGAVGLSSVELRENLIGLFGSLDNLIQSTQYYRENFLTDAEQIAPVASAVSGELSRLGLSSVTSIDAFKNVVTSLDMTTDAGQQLFASLMALAPGFKAVIDYQDKMAQQLAAQAKSYRDLQTQAWALESEAGLYGNAPAQQIIDRQREDQLASLDDASKGMARYTFQLQDMIKAQDAAAASLKSYRDLQTQAWEWEAKAGLYGNAPARQIVERQREDQLAGLDDSSKAMARYIYYLQDMVTVQEAAAASLKSYRDQQTRAWELEAALGMYGAAPARQILERQREDELAGLDAASQAMARYVYELQDQLTAQNAATEAAAKAADLAKSRSSLEAQILELMGDKAGALAITRQLELDAMDAALRPLKETVYALQDMAAAADVARQAAEKFGGLRDNLLKARDDILGTSSDGGTYLQAQREFLKLQALAMGGDATGLAGLGDAAKALVKISEANATEEQFKRDTSMALAALGRAAGVADQQVTEQQAIVELSQQAVLLTGAATDMRDIFVNLTSGNADLVAKLESIRTDMKTGHVAIATNTAKASTQLERWDRLGVPMTNSVDEDGNAEPLIVEDAA